MKKITYCVVLVPIIQSNTPTQNSHAGGIAHAKVIKDYFM